MAAKSQIKVLSIDGGGIRGIIPAVMLAEIERRTERPVCELFDLIAGTSTGGIIALGLTVPDPAVPRTSSSPRWSAAELAEMYEVEGPHIFHRSLIRTITTVDGIWEEKYAAEGLEASLDRYLGEALLSDALADVLITSYDIYNHEPFFFKSFQPLPRVGSSASATPSKPSAQPLGDYQMRVVARATSAAPTYFEPEPIPVAPLPTAGGAQPFVLVDGGTFANNPAMCAYAEALRNNTGVDVLVVSLGTGRLSDSIAFKQAQHWGIACWARPLLSVMMDGSSAAIDYQLDELLGFDVNHFRFQTLLAGVSDALDDASPSNIAGLRKLADASIAENASRLEKVCKLLVR
jgi:uncharacterized protein